MPVTTRGKSSAGLAGGTQKRQPSILSEGLLNNPDSPFHKELLHEREAIDRGRAKRKRTLEAAVEKDRGSTLAPAQKVMRLWHHALAESIKQWRRGKPRHDEISTIAVIRAVNPNILSQIALANIVNGIMRHPNGVSVAVVARRIGRDIEAVLKGRVVAQELRNIAKANPCQCSKCVPGGERRVACQKIKRLRGVRRLMGDRETNRILKIARMHPQHLPDELEHVEQTVYFLVGEKLVTHARWACELTNKDERGEPVTKFALDLRIQTIRGEYGGVKRPYSIVPSEDTVRLLHREIDRWIARKPTYPFTLVQPPAWSDPEAGGYIVIRKGVIANGKREQYEALEGADLSRVFKGLDALGSVQWQNTPQVQSVIDAIVTGKLPGVLKGRWDKIRWVSGVENVPPGDDPERPNHPMLGQCGSIEALRAWKKTPEGLAWKLSTEGRAWRFRARRLNDHIDELKSWRELFALQHHSMREAGKHDHFFLGHDICFRGRAKPQELYFSHHGPDVMRGLLRFARPGLPCPDMGHWLSVNAANRWGQGLDKGTLEAKGRFAADHAGMIRDVAADPLKCLDWLKADEPFQFLSACVAIHDPEHALKVPIYLDATANGLQHFSAAGRDPVGAALVNLVDGPERIITYRVLANACRPFLEADGSGLASRILSVLDDKLVKTPVLATPYGVTVMGMKEQLVGEFVKRGFRDDEAWDAADFLSKVIAKAMRKVCPAAIAILEWIRSCAKLACRPTSMYPNGRPFRFTSPTGLPVHQAYRNESTVRVKVNGHSYQIDRAGNNLPVNMDRQVNGAAPNVVHSWDAANAAEVAIAAVEAGMNIATIYDCFGTTVDRVAEVGQLFRQKFVELHERNLIDDLYAQLQAGYPDVNFPPPPAKGNFDLRHVLKSTYALG